MQCCVAVQAIRRKQKNTPTLIGEEVEGLWIVLFSLVAPFEDKVLTVLSLIVAFGLACYLN